MNKLFFICAPLLLIHSCGFFDRLDIKRDDCHYLVNNTSKRFVHEVYCDMQYVNNDTFTFVSTDSLVGKKLEWIISGVYGKEKGINPYRGAAIYCIDDTTSVKWFNLWGKMPLEKGGCNNYFCVTLVDTKETDDEILYTKEYDLIVNDSLMAEMQKDYSMLNKFPQYYANK